MGRALMKLTAQERDVALLTLAAYGGNTARAARALKEQGITITARTLLNWRTTTHAERYVELSQQHAREIEGVAVVRMRETILQAADVQQQALEQASKQLQAGEARDPSAVARNAAVVAGINSQHNLTYTGRPNVITQHDSAEEILRRLHTRHPGMFVEAPPAWVDSTAEEVGPIDRIEREMERRRDAA